MYTEQVLWTCSGGMKLIYLPQFAKMIPHQMTNDLYVDTAHLEEPRAFWDPHIMSEINVPVMTNYSRQTHELKPFHEDSAADLIKKPHDSGVLSHMVREEMFIKALKRIEEEFKIMVAKKTPAFFMKDLSIANLEKLAEEFAKNFGQDSCGINVQLSPYQKFFAIADAADFKFFCHKYEKHTVNYPVTVFAGKLADLRPEKWVMGRYEDLTYMKEVNAYNLQKAVVGGEPGK